MIRFNDGENFDTSGEFRTERRKDGLYVVGKGMLIPVDSQQEADEIINKDKENKKQEFNK